MCPPGRKDCRPQMLAACQTALFLPGTAWTALTRQPIPSVFKPGHSPFPYRMPNPAVIRYKCRVSMCGKSNHPCAESGVRAEQCLAYMSGVFVLLLAVCRQGNTFSIIGRVVSPLPDRIRFPAWVPPMMRSRLCNFRSASVRRRAFTCGRSLNFPCGSSGTLDSLGIPTTLHRSKP